MILVAWHSCNCVMTVMTVLQSQNMSPMYDTSGKGFCRDSLASLFCETRLLALCSTPATLGDLGFSVRVVSLSWFVPIIALGTRVSPLHGLAIFQRFQGSWRGHACTGLDRNKWHFPDFYWCISTSKICTSEEDIKEDIRTNQKERCKLENQNQHRTG